jgi:hypothetical protein
MDCRAWNGGIAECRGSCVTVPPVYACAGPNASKVITVLPNNPKGNHDSSDCNTSWGWACDGDNYSTPLSIHFYKDGPAGVGTYIGATTANLAREPAVGGQCGGNVNHGFSFATPLSLRDNVAHTIYAYGINIGGGGNVLLSSTPKTITCPPIPPTACFDGQPNLKVISHQVIILVFGTSNDSSADMNVTEVYWRKYDAIKLVWGPWNLNKYDPYPLTSTHNFNGNWGPGGLLGDYQLVVNSYDSMGGKCTGNPDYTYPWNGWTDCSPTCDLLAYRACGIAPGLSSGNACTILGNTMTLTWGKPVSWGDVCTLPIQNVYKIYADTTNTPPSVLRCTNTGENNTTCVVNNVLPGEEYLWRVETNNGGPLTTTSGNYPCDIPSTVNDWFTSINGDVYAPGISASIPSTLWDPKHVGYSSSSYLIVVTLIPQ